MCVEWIHHTSHVQAVHDDDVPSKDPWRSEGRRRRTNVHVPHLRGNKCIHIAPSKRAILRTQGRIQDVQHTSDTSPDGKKRAWQHPRVVHVFLLLCICFVSSPFVSIRVVPTHAHVSWPRRIDADASSACHATNDSTSSTWCCFTNHVDLLESTASSWVSVEETKTRATEDVRSQTNGHTTNERVVRTKARRGS